MDNQILFSCTKCAQPLTVDAAGAGMQVECPACQQLLTVPAASEGQPAAAAGTAGLAEPGGGDAGGLGGLGGSGGPVGEPVTGGEGGTGSAAARTTGAAMDRSTIPPRTEPRGESAAGKALPKKNAAAGSRPELPGKRGTVLPGARAERGAGDPGLMAGSVPTEVPPKRSGRVTTLPQGGAEHDLRAAMTGAPLTQDQVKAAAQRAREVMGVGVGWFWLRVILLVLMLALMAFLLRQVVELRRPVPETLEVPKTAPLAGAPAPAVDPEGDAATATGAEAAPTEVGRGEGSPQP